MHINIVLLSVLVISLSNFNNALFLKKKLLAHFLQPESPPAIHTAYGPPDTHPTTTEEPLLKATDWSALFEAFKTKIHDHNPIVKLYRYFKQEHKETKPEYKFVPALGFTHYNKIHYYPIVEKESDKLSNQYGLPKVDITTTSPDLDKNSSPPGIYAPSS